MEKKEEKKPVLTGAEKRSIATCMMLVECFDIFLMRKFGKEYIDSMNQISSDLLKAREDLRKKSASPKDPSPSEATDGDKHPEDGES